MTPAPLTMATPEQAVRLFEMIALVLTGLSLNLAAIVLGGDLNAEQRRHLQAALRKVDGLETVFRAERERQAALRARATKES